MHFLQFALAFIPITLICLMLVIGAISELATYFLAWIMTECENIYWSWRQKRKRARA